MGSVQVARCLSRKKISSRPSKWTNCSRCKTQSALAIVASIITSWNTAAEKMFGYTATEAIGRLITILMPADRVDEEGTIVERLKPHVTLVTRFRERKKTVTRQNLVTGVMVVLFA
jgi:PAS domain-containing protein